MVEVSTRRVTSFEDEPRVSSGQLQALVHHHDLVHEGNSHDLFTARNIPELEDAKLLLVCSPKDRVGKKWKIVEIVGKSYQDGDPGCRIVGLFHECDHMMVLHVDRAEDDQKVGTLSQEEALSLKEFVLKQGGSLESHDYVALEEQEACIKVEELSMCECGCKKRLHLVSQRAGRSGNGSPESGSSLEGGQHDLFSGFSDDMEVGRALGDLLQGMHQAGSPGVDQAYAFTRKSERSLEGGQRDLFTGFSDDMDAGLMWQGTSQVGSPEVVHANAGTRKPALSLEGGQHDLFSGFSDDMEVGLALGDLRQWMHQTGLPGVNQADAFTRATAGSYQIRHPVELRRYGSDEDGGEDEIPDLVEDEDTSSQPDSTEDEDTSSVPDLELDPLQVFYWEDVGDPNSVWEDDTAFNSLHQPTSEDCTRAAGVEVDTEREFRDPVGSLELEGSEQQAGSQEQPRYPESIWEEYESERWEKEVPGGSRGGSGLRHELSEDEDVPYDASKARLISEDFSRVMPRNMMEDPHIKTEFNSEEVMMSFLDTYTRDDREPTPMGWMSSVDVYFRGGLDHTMEFLTNRARRHHLQSLAGSRRYPPSALVVRTWWPAVTNESGEQVGGDTGSRFIATVGKEGRIHPRTPADVVTQLGDHELSRVPQNPEVPGEKLIVSMVLALERGIIVRGVTWVDGAPRRIIEAESRSPTFDLGWFPEEERAREHETDQQRSLRLDEEFEEGQVLDSEELDHLEELLDDERVQMVGNQAVVLVERNLNRLIERKQEEREEWLMEATDAHEEEFRSRATAQMKYDTRTCGMEYVRSPAAEAEEEARARKKMHASWYSARHKREEVMRRLEDRIQGSGLQRDPKMMLTAVLKARREAELVPVAFGSAAVAVSRGNWDGPPPESVVGRERLSRRRAADAEPIHCQEGIMVFETPEERADYFKRVRRGERSDIRNLARSSPETWGPFDVTPGRFDATPGRSEADPDRRFEATPGRYSEDELREGVPEVAGEHRACGLKRETRAEAVQRMRDADLDTLLLAAQSHVEAGIATTTLATYMSAWRKYERWCVIHGIDPYSCVNDRAAEDQILTYFTFLRDKECLKASTLKVTRSAIKHFHVVQGYPSPTDSIRITEMFKGFNNDAIARKQPITMGALQAICKRLRNHVWDELVLKTVLLVMFTFLMRSRECLGAGINTDKDQCLLIGDMMLVKRGEGIPRGAAADGADEIILRFRKSKNDQGGNKHELMSITEDQDSPNCPVGLLVEMTRLCPGLMTQRTRYFATLQNGSVLTKRAVADVLKDQAERMGLDRSIWSVISLRSGGASAMRDAGYSAEDIKIRGRWKSECWKVYVWEGRDKAKGLSKKLLNQSVSLLATQMRSGST